MTDYTEILETLLERLINEGGYSEINTPSMTQGITAMADGLWLNILISASGFKRSDAEKVMMQYLRATFPKHKDAFY